jgi:GNAT superfamily N-acetyltransferase
MTPDRAAITLVPLSDGEYAAFTRQQVAENARQHLQAGEWTMQEALTRSREELTDLLTDALRAAGHVFLKGTDAHGTPIGWLWVAPAPEFLGENRERKRWLSQITVEESLRGRGYGGALLVALHGWLAAQGVEELWLRVYDWNEAARRLYARAGYDVMRQFSTDAHLRRSLVGVSGDSDDVRG